MGRQKGEGARSKTRPSSSSQAAALLPSSSATAAAAVGFGGYVGSSRLESSLSGEGSNSPLDVDSEVAQHLKRLGRKDPTTKLKALASLSGMLKQKPRKDLIAIIPQWAFEYKKLVLDYNRDVRRAAHDVMSDLVSAVGRDLAPHLKSLMGPWWFSQFDPVSEVSQAAKRSFQVAFSAQEKRLDALILCISEVFTYLEENLKLTPQDLTEKAVALDELEEMHQQGISSSLLAVATLLDVLVCPRPENSGFENIAAVSKHACKARKTAVSSAEKLFQTHNHFLDFLKSQSPNIRSATYSVLRSFIRNVPQAFDDGNMKTVATAILGAFRETNPVCHSSMWEAILLFSKRFPESWTCINVQKVVFNPFWNFLRNGCFGSQQVSYPALIPFLEIVPPKAVQAEKYFLNFFKSFWAGRNRSTSSDGDRLAFFSALRECFLWVLHNVSRYFVDSDSVSHFRVTLVDEVILKLLWQSYLPPATSTDEGVDFIEMSEAGGLPQKKTVETLSTYCSIRFLRDLGRSIVEILSGIYMLEKDLLFPFCSFVEETCIKFFLQKDNIDRSDGFIGRISEFILLLDTYAIQKGETWPSVHFITPLLSKSFPLIKSLDSLAGLKLLSVSVSVFGPRKVIRTLTEENGSSSRADDILRELDLESFMQVFKNIFVPWCLDEQNNLTSARLDLLLALFDDESFVGQWHAVISYAFTLGCKGERPECLSCSHLTVLAMLLEKARVEIAKREKQRDLSFRMGSDADSLHHQLLETAAITVACSSPPFEASAARFLRAVLGGSSQGAEPALVSNQSLTTIFKGIQQKLLAFVWKSAFSSVKNACCLLTCGVDDRESNTESSAEVIEMASFALEVIDGSIFCLKALNEDIGLCSSIFAATFIIDWEYSMTNVIDYGLDSESKEKIGARISFYDQVHAFRSKISNQFWKDQSSDARETLVNILIKFIRSVMLNEEVLNPTKLSSLCCLWLLEVLECLSVEQGDEDNFMDHLLIGDDVWPLCVIPDRPKNPTKLRYCNIYDDKRASRSARFVSFLEKLILKVGIDQVILGYNKDGGSPPDETVSNGGASRAWLAAEVLCTWKWPGGSVKTSFLPKISSLSGKLRDELLNSTVNILLDGALVHGESGAQDSFVLWPILSQEVGSIREPFLRALVSLLSTLFKDNIWGGEDAETFFKLLKNKLFIGEDLSINCLRILPLIMGVLILPIDSRRNGAREDGEEDDELKVHKSIKGWLHKTLSFPPLVTWQTGEDMQEWFQLVISCYPLRVKDEKGKKLARNVSHEERILLLDLFRKQRHVASASSVINQLPIVQALLSKLVAISVNYCWMEFNEEDWDFVFSNLRRWIQNAVVMMEEVAENVNDIITGSSSTDNEDVFLQGHQRIVLDPDPSSLSIAENALSSFSLCSSLVRLETDEAKGSLMLSGNEKYDNFKDRILEGILRLFFCTGLAEAVAGSHSREAAEIIASSRLEHAFFWDLVASIVVDSSQRSRDRAVKSVEFWGLSKGAVSSLYAILFSSETVPSLRFAAYLVLSSEPVSQLAIVAGGTALSNDGSYYDQESSNIDLSNEDGFRLREEISDIIEKLPYEVLDTDLMAPERVNVFLAWSLLLSHLSSLPSLSQPRERLVQCIRDSANSLILDGLFQHIPLELCMVHGLKRKEKGELPPEVSEIATAATRAITMGSLISSVESLWPTKPARVASLAGAIYGLMLRVLPAYVREWFSGLRDRSASSMIETYTRGWCSPPLITNELHQIKKANLGDENFSVSVSKSANEVVATYTKDDTGMDLVIKLPASYPLRPVDVDCTRSLGISEVKQRKWLMSMMLFVRNQNGALAEAIRIWKQNFDKEFEGVEECPICYSIIHTTNYSLPRLACKTCKYRFHAACLYKWFSTSHKSSCPLCQSPF